MSREVGEKIVERIKWWEEYTARNKGEMNNNPSPGNKAGGLTTILEKSLGAVAKGGTTGLMDVYEYAQPVTAKGFVFMDTPGYDPVSATGQVAGGANMICFTTGRGSVYGCKPSPSLKLATNTDCTSGRKTTWTSTAARSSTARRRCRSRREDLRADPRDRVGRAEQERDARLRPDEFVPWQLGAVM